MARRDKYHINYEKLYPGIEIPPEVLSVLRKGDRKEEYQEVDLKQERFVYDPETKTAHFIPGREDSYERLVEDEKRQFSNEDPTPEEHLMRSIENELLRQAVALLKEDERQLILLRFWQECSQSQVAELLGLSQQAVSYRERNILGKIKKFLKK
ncbi:sigma-70 family RNA polymerase sigma factor [Flavonifractor sp. DFI.6.63]|jgi:RNA polymerase sigma factor, sigma-70 family|uniref:sigma-70 family RNA polymerase sigma factor n=1 Tax=Oscillospiraceae TaxID=216572 RepID=UPI0009DEC787|nr:MULTISPECIES: sigma-70 family RNA polymerase sigma factor [Oscillospiraceae]MCQ5028599.1 sigma-70 family RNA polymerase sigma factor [Flavonifractor sp. DFI.6.63]HJH83904.1 sigma-70 family RNA polymerase sigma factor [Clostridiales bacterium]